MNRGKGKTIDNAGAKALLGTRQTLLVSVLVDNGLGAKSYLQLFDAAATGDVTLGTTVPDAVVPIDANAVAHVMLNQSFTHGIVYAVTTAWKGDTAVGNGCNITFIRS